MAGRSLVLRIQQTLVDRGYYLEMEDGSRQELAVDGIWGPDTDQVVRQFQADEGLVADGIVGPVTYAKLFPQEGVSEVAGETQPPLDVESLMSVCRPNLGRHSAEIYLPFILAAMDEAEINTPLRQAHFLAQIAHESNGLKYWTELGAPAYFTRYDGRRDLGNVNPGDGYKFRGRGPIQLTGRANYTAAGRDLGIDLVGHPDQVATAGVGFRTSAWYWAKRNINALADEDDMEAVTRAVNGGLNGLASREIYLARAKEALGVA